jgi:tRNA(Ile)-lysidine synthase
MQTREQPQAVIRNFLLRMEQHLRRHGLIRPGVHIVLGVSGGTDSMAMLDAFSRLQKKWKLRLSIAHVNYGLRGAASDGDERFVRRAAKKYGAAVCVKRAETRTIARSRKVSIQLAARDIRYEFFTECARELGAQAIAVAHHAGDNAETMLFNFFRGSGIEGLKGIPVSALPSAPDGPRLIRPLLFAERAEIDAYMKACRLKHREDASNSSSDYSRNFIRRTVIPAVEKRINPSLKRTLNTEAAIFSSCAGFVGSVVNQSATECISKTPNGYALSVKHLAQKHVFIQHMLVKRCLLLLGIEPDFVHIEEIIGLLEGQSGRRIDCGGGVSARRSQTAIEIGRGKSAASFILSAEENESIGTPEFTFRIRRCVRPNKFHPDPSTEYVDAASIRLPLTIRPWRSGDRFMPLGMKAMKKLSDFFIDRKIPRDEKARIPIVLSGDEIVWIAGVRLDDRFKVTPRTQSVYQLSIQFHI